MIRYLKDKNGDIHIYSELTVSSAPDSFVELTDDELHAYLNPISDKERARSQRDALLAELDMIVTNPLRWSTFDDTQKQALADYRQALLDVPQQEGFPENINWPIKPEVI